MRTRRWKRVGYCFLGLALGLTVAALVLQRRLPGILAGRIVREMAAQGLHDPSVRSVSVDPWETQVRGVRASTDSWRLELDTATAGYRPLQLLQGRIDGIHLVGLHLDWTPISPQESAVLVPATPADIGPLLETWPDSLPLRAFSLSNSSLRIRRNGRDLTLAMSAVGAISNDTTSLRALVEADPSNTWVKVDGHVSGTQPTEGAIEFRIDDPTSWVGLALGGPLPPGVAQVRSEPWSGQLAVTIPPGATDATVTGSLREFRLNWSGAQATVHPILASAIAGREGLGALRVASGLDLALDSGLDISAPEMSLALDETRGTFQVPELSVNTAGTWQLTGLTGEYRGPFGDEAALSAAGQLAGRWSSNLVAEQPLPFRVEVARDHDRTAGTLSLDLTNVFSPALVALSPNGLHGRLRVSANLETNLSQFSALFDWAAAQASGSAWAVKGLALTGEARLTQGPVTQPGLPAFALRLLPLMPAGWLERLGASEIDLRGKAESAESPIGLRLDEPVVQLRRKPTAEGAPLPWMAVELGATSAFWRGLTLTALHATSALEGEEWRVDATASLADVPCPFRARWRVVGTEPAQPTLLGQLELGPLKLRDYPIPAELAGGADLRITGEITVTTQVRQRADGRWEASPSVVLDLTRLEWPAQKLTFEHLRATLGFTSTTPLQSRTRDLITVGRMTYDDYAATDIVAAVESLPDHRVRLELVDAQLFGGRVTTPPFLYDFVSGDGDFPLTLEGLDLDRLSRTIPDWKGELTGRVSGRIPLRRRAGQWRVLSGRLELDPEVPARIHYPAAGLFTAGLSPESPRYEQLRMVEDGLENLALGALTVDVADPKTPHTAIRLRLEGTSASPRAIVPVILNLNINGPFQEILGLLGSGGFEWSF